MLVLAWTSIENQCPRREHVSIGLYINRPFVEGNLEYTCRIVKVVVLAKTSIENQCPRGENVSIS